MWAAAAAAVSAEGMTGVEEKMKRAIEIRS